MKKKSFHSPDFHSISALTAPTQVIVLARFLGCLAARQWLAAADDRPHENFLILSGGALGSLLNQPGTRMTGGALGQCNIGGAACQ